ncbi:MAG: ribosome maturation factor RimM [Gemmatimonadota bacterium]|nr:ribosome maturation factor RimM [Gemmatimonadota bacterium]
MTSTAYAIVGRIRKPQGIRGDVTVELLTDEPDRLFAPGSRVFAGTATGNIANHPADRANLESREELRVESASPYRGGLIIKFDAIPDRTAAEMWRQRYLLVPNAEITPPAENEVFMHDLVGMQVRGDDGTEVGNVTGLYELPQGLTLEVTREGSHVLVPYRPAVVRDVDLDERVVTVLMSSGLFE